MEIDIYDFDKTVIPFDSGSKFWGYCLVHYPWIILLFPVQLAAGLLAFTGITDFTAFKKICFSFVPFIPLESAVKGFWNKYEKQVHKWFYNRKRACAVISASPDFLLEEISERLGFDCLICTRHNRKTGSITGKNCRSDEKVKRFRKQFPDARVIDVYSDSVKHDRPIFSLAEGQCYHVVNGNLIPFDFNEMYGE